MGEIINKWTVQLSNGSKISRLIVVRATAQTQAAPEIMHLMKAASEIMHLMRASRKSLSHHCHYPLCVNKLFWMISMTCCPIRLQMWMRTCRTAIRVQRWMRNYTREVRCLGNKQLIRSLKHPLKFCRLFRIGNDIASKAGIDDVWIIFATNQIFHCLLRRTGDVSVSSANILRNIKNNLTFSIIIYVMQF